MKFNATVRSNQKAFEAWRINTMVTVRQQQDFQCTLLVFRLSHISLVFCSSFQHKTLHALLMKLFTQVITSLYICTIYTTQWTWRILNSACCFQWAVWLRKRKKKIKYTNRSVVPPKAWISFPSPFTRYYTDDTFVTIKESGLLGQSKMNSSAWQWGTWDLAGDFVEFLLIPIKLYNTYCYQRNGH